jgi:predicted phage-related endonuclease
MHYMIVTRLRVFHLGALVGGNDARYYRIDYDPELAKLLVDHARKFWRCVESRTPPAPVSLTDVDLRWPRSLERSIVATDTIKSAVAELKSIREVEAEAAKKGDAIEVSLKAYMGEADALSDGKRMLATWKTQERERFAQKEFAKDHPELLQQYRTSSSFRVFRLK